MKEVFSSGGYKTDGPCRLCIKDLPMSGTHLRKILKIGIPAGVSSVTYALSNIIIQTSINDFGTDTIAAWGTYGKYLSVSSYH